MIVLIRHNNLVEAVGCDARWSVELARSSTRGAKF